MNNMNNKCKITGIAFLLIMLMALINSPPASADGLAIDSQSCSAASGNVTFTISINNAPNNVSAFGLAVSFDDNILEFVKFNKEADLADFMVTANKNKTLPVLNVGGYYTGGREFGIAAGANVKIGELVFKVKRCEPATLAIASLSDDIKTWQAQAGKLIPPVQYKFSLGDTVVKFSANDKAGNTSECRATVRVVDTKDPTITCPGDITVPAQDQNGAYKDQNSINTFLNGATATDTADDSVAITTDAPEVFPIGPRTVIFTATDDAGHTATCEAIVTVADQTAPTIENCTDGEVITVEAEGSYGVSIDNQDVKIFLHKLATDNVDGPVSVTACPPNCNPTVP